MCSSLSILWHYLSPTRENIMEVLRKLKIEVQSDPAIPYLGVYTEKTKI